MDVRFVSARVNGALVEVAVGTTLAELVKEVSPDTRGIAVAMNREVVPRSLWCDRVVDEGCDVEILGPAAGG